MFVNMKVDNIYIHNVYVWNVFGGRLNIIGFGCKLYWLSVVFII